MTVIVGSVVVLSEVVNVEIDIVDVAACMVMSIVEVAATIKDVDVGQCNVLRSVTVVVA